MILKRFTNLVKIEWNVFNHSVYQIEWNIIVQKDENCEEWRKLVVKSTVVPQRSARLQVRRDEMRDTRCPYSVALVHGTQCRKSTESVPFSSS